MKVSDGYKLKILMVDDNEDDFETVKRAANKVDFPCELHWCDSGEECINFLHNCLEDEKHGASTMPNIIFMDINMPGLDGKQTLMRIKQNKQLCAIPVLMFTTSASEKDINECYGIGANSYITKPHSYNDLVKIFEVVDRYWMNVSSLPISGS